MPNRLINETSPYLLQHANNPVDWYPWGPDALARAKAEDKPIFLSIGYSSCHWCHVMERESFENPDTAAQLNESFVAIKVDREERPDIDSVYMDAVQALSGHGGWPLSVFLSPDGAPFFGGTYYPPDDRPGMPGFPRVLATVLDAYRSRGTEIQAAGANIVDHMRRATAVTGAADVVLTPGLLTDAVQRIRDSYDAVNGGFGTVPKFPQPMLLEFLLRHNANNQDSDVLSMIEYTLERMARGGVYDQLGGGFHRYSTDAQWAVPHFEKMLYDNALLLSVYLHAYQVTGHADALAVVEETVDFLFREMRDPRGGFYSTLDADSEGEEGRFYVWTRDEIHNALSSDAAALVCQAYGVTEAGNFEGGNQTVLNRVVGDEELAVANGMDVDALRTALRAARDTLLSVRAQRVRPSRDGKILTAWNGLLLRALSEVAGTLHRDDYRVGAVELGDFLVTNLKRDDGRLLRSYKDGEARIPAYLEDYANLANGLLALFELTFDRRWLDETISLADGMLDLFWDQDAGIFYDTGSDAEELVLRPRSVLDNATPSGGAAATELLLRLSALTGSQRFRQAAERALQGVELYLSRYPGAVGNWLSALDFYLATPKEIALIGERDSDGMRAFLAGVYERFMPNKIVVAVAPDQIFDWDDLPVLDGRTMINGLPTAFVCENYVCQLPVTDAARFLEQLDAPPQTIGLI